MKAIRLKTSGLYEPLGIDVKNPRLSWNCCNGVKQTAYQVVASAPSGEVLFDSGKVESDHMYCKYQGRALTSRQRVLWKVGLWDAAGVCEWSQTAWFEMGLIKKADWQARWICGVDTDKAVRLPADYYLKKFWVNEDLLQARLYITSLGVYSARVNDVCVSSVLAPGTTQYNKTLYYQTYDVTAQMSLAQENRLMLTVGDGWYKGKLGADQKEYLFGTQTKLLAQLELCYASGKREIIGTDETFLWSADGPVRFSDLKDGEVYDARKKPEFVAHAVVDTNEQRIPTASNAPAIAEHEVFSATLEISPSGGKILDFGQNMAGYVRFHVCEPEGTKITLRLFEALDHGEYSDISLSFPAGDVAPVKQEITYIASGKDEWFYPEFFYSGFQYALVEGVAVVRPEDFEAVAVYSDMEFGGKFSCSNEMLNKFVNNTCWSMKSNFVDVPTDCPQREKAGWTGDAQVFCKTAVCFADTFAFYRKWLKDIKDCQRENGLVEDVNPRVNPPGTRMDMVSGSSGWADAAVILPYTLWKQSGDVSFIYDNYELMQGWMNYIIHICQDKSMFCLPDGHPLSTVYQTHRLKDSPWNRFIPEMGVHWGEWCVPQSQEPPEGDPAAELIKPKQEVTCAYVHYSMTMLEEMLRFIGRDTQADTCREYACGSREAYHVHWVENEQINTGHMAELVRPIALGLLTESEKKNVAEALNAMVIQRNYKVGTGFLSTPLLLQVLAENGYVDTAYKMLENTQAPGWLAMVNQGATTVWEEYECYDENGSPLPHSFNHYSPGAMCGFLFDTVCGIRVTGENELTLSPVPGGTLTWAKAKILTAYGPVESRWEKRDGFVQYTFNIPANVTAKVILPDGSSQILMAGEHQLGPLLSRQLIRSIPDANELKAMLDKLFNELGE